MPDRTVGEGEGDGGRTDGRQTEWWGRTERRGGRTGSQADGAENGGRGRRARQNGGRGRGARQNGGGGEGSQTERRSYYKSVQQWPTVATFFCYRVY